MRGGENVSGAGYSFLFRNRGAGRYAKQPVRRNISQGVFEMTIKKVPLEKLNPAAYNPRKDLRPGDPEYEKLKHSIETFGCVQTIVWNERTGNVVGGHQTLKVLKDLGLTEADVSVVDLDESHEKALNVALNKISGEWDNEKLFEVIKSLNEEDIDATISGFDEDEIEQILEATTNDLNLDDFFADAPEKSEKENPEKSITCPKCGFVFQAGDS
jgi:ParB-like chromosome segregation protein Spo0J